MKKTKKFMTRYTSHLINTDTNLKIVKGVECLNYYQVRIFHYMGFTVE